MNPEPPKPDTHALQVEFDRKRQKAAAIGELLQSIKGKPGATSRDRSPDRSRFDGLPITFNPVSTAVLVTIPSSGVEPPWSRENARPLSDWIHFLRGQPQTRNRQITIVFDDDLLPLKKDLQQLEASRINLLRPYYGQKLVLGAEARLKDYLEYQERHARKKPGAEP